jgi:hypothetical protein
MSNQNFHNNRVIAFINDLFFQAKVKVVCDQNGFVVQFHQNTDPKMFPEPLGVKIVLVDLNLKSKHPEDFLKNVRRAYSSCMIYAFGPHVEPELFQLAKNAGIDAVMARSKFSKDLPGIINPASIQA